MIVKGISPKLKKKKKTSKRRSATCSGVAEAPKTRSRSAKKVKKEGEIDLASSARKEEGQNIRANLKATGWRD